MRFTLNAIEREGNGSWDIGAADAREVEAGHALDVAAQRELVAERGRTGVESLPLESLPLESRAPGIGGRRRASSGA